MFDPLTKYDRVGWLIHSIHRYNVSYLFQKMEDLDIGPGQFHLLMMLNQQDGISQRSLSEMSHVDETTVARSIRRLVDGKYIVRDRDEGDQRAYVIRLTEKGRETITTLDEISKQFDRDIFDGFDESEREQAIYLMRRMVANAQEKGGEEMEEALKRMRKLRCR
jgi:DNA-binding MarR family transcriptional regulator